MPTTDIIQQLNALAKVTGNVLPHEACLTAGLSQEQLEWLVEKGRWQRPYPRTFVPFSGPIPPITKQFAALSYAGDGAMLSHASSGSTYRMCAVPPRIELLIPYPRKVDEQPGLWIHRSKTLLPSHAHPVFVPRRARVERTLIDLLPRAQTVEAALSLVADAIRTKQTNEALLRLWVITCPRVRWKDVVLQALPDAGAGAHSLLELLDARLRHRHGLPLGERQVERTEAGVEFLDVLDDAYRIHCESDGRLGHDRAIETWRDMRRDNRSEVKEYRHLRYGWLDYLENSCAVAIQLGLVYRQQGWLGKFRRCRRCPRTLPSVLA